MAFGHQDNSPYSTGCVKFTANHVTQDDHVIRANADSNSMPDDQFKSLSLQHAHVDGHSSFALPVAIKTPATGLVAATCIYVYVI